MTKQELSLLPYLVRQDAWINGYRGGYFEASPTDEVRRRCHGSTKVLKTFERGFMAGTRSWRKDNARGPVEGLHRPTAD